MSYKLNRGDSHLGIGQYMRQAGWLGVAPVRKFLGYDDSKIQLQTAKHNGKYDTDTPYDTEEFKSHIDYANQSKLYQYLYMLVGHKYTKREYDDGGVRYWVRPTISTLDNPELLHSPTCGQYDADAVVPEAELRKPPKGNAFLTRKVTQGWQQLRGSFEPMRKSLKGLTKVFARYKSPGEAIHNDALGFVYGAGNVVEGLTQIVLVPFFLIFRLLKNLGLLLRHPFTGASYKNLFVRFARDVGYAGTWFIEGTLETVQGVVRISMQVPKWFIQIPLRYIRTFWTGSKTYATFAENAGTKVLIHFANQQANTKLIEVLDEQKIHADHFNDLADNAFLAFIDGIKEAEDEEKTLRNHSWTELKSKVGIGGLQTGTFLQLTWHDFCAAGNHLLTVNDKAGQARHITPEFEPLVTDCYRFKKAKQYDEYKVARTEMIAILEDGLKAQYLKNLNRNPRLSENTSSIFNEIDRKAGCAVAKEQVVDVDKRDKIQHVARLGTYYNGAKEAIHAYDRDAAKPEFL